MRTVRPTLAIAALLFAAACAPAASPPAQPTAAPAAPKAAAPTTAPAAAPTTAPAKPAAAPTTAAAAPAAPASAAKPSAINIPPPEIKRIKIVHATLENTQLAYLMARDREFFQKYGFEDVELVFAEGDARSLQTIIAGQVDFSAQGVSQSISSQISDVPLVTLAMTATTLTDAIVSTSDVKSAADLKGKSLAISSFGGTSHGAALLGLDALGLTDRDVTVQQVGGQAARIAALTAGSVPGAVVDVTLEDEMKAQGFNILTRLPDNPKEFGRNGLLVRREFMEKNPNTVLAATAAILEGQNYIWTNPEETTDSFVKWAQMTNRDTAKKQVTDFHQYGKRDMRWTPAAFDLTRTVLASVNAEVANVDLTKAYSFEALDKLRDMGFYESIGAPRPQ